MRILIAEDDTISRRLLQARLVKWGYDVVAACDGAEAWHALQREDAPKLAILDWMMPGMDGIEVCRKVRQRTEAPYIYILLLTAKNQKEDVIKGINTGADDYLTKPFDASELQVRLNAGRRIIELEAALLGELTERKRAEEALEQTRRQEIKIASDIQQMLLLDRPPQLPGMSVAVRTIPSQEVDGDFYYFFKHREQCLDVVVGDVMGKGILAAFVGAGTKSQFLHARSHLLSLSHGELPRPEEIVMGTHAEMTRQLMDLESFVTLCYARFDLEERQVVFVDCGHTKTIHFRRRLDSCGVLEGDNMPFGISEREIYKQVSVPIGTGDVFFFYSDGITEARNEAGEFFGEDRLSELIRTNSQLDPEALIDRIFAEVVAFSNSETFGDDLTGVAVKIEDTEGAVPIPHAQLVTSSDPTELARMRTFVRAFCREIPGSVLNEENIIQLELAVNEAASNIMKHAYHGRTDGHIQIEADAFADRVSIRFYHQGDAFDPKAIEPPAFDGSREEGFGVFIIDRCVDEVHYSRDEQGRNCLCLTKYRENI